MKLYHASKSGMLHVDGIRTNVEKNCCNFNDGYVYLGSLEYLNEQYFSYCPKGLYYIFEVQVDFLKLEYLNKVEHYRHLGDISPKFVRPFDVKVIR